MYQRFNKKGNQKVKNASKVDEFGNKIENLKEFLIKNPGARYYDSMIEYKFSEAIKDAELDHLMKEKVKIEISPGFKYFDKNHNAVTWEYDFGFPDLNIVLDTKGYPTETFKMKYRMIVWYYLSSFKTVPYILFVKNQKSIPNAVHFIKKCSKGDVDQELLKSFLFHNVFGKKRTKNGKGTNKKSDKK